MRFDNFATNTNRLLYILSCIIYFSIYTFFISTLFPFTMVEAMYEQSPEFFKKFQKRYRFFMSDEHPSAILNNNTECVFSHHAASHKFCNISNKNHYHVLAEMDSETIKKVPSKCYVVPCLYTCYKYLVFNQNEVRKGDVIERLHRAVEYNIQTNNILDEQSSNILRKLPFICSNTKTHSKTQTDILPASTLSRFQKILTGPNGLYLYQIMDILESGSGSISIDDDHKRLKLCFESSLDL